MGCASSAPKANCFRGGSSVVRTQDGRALSFYDLTEVDADGNSVDFAQYRGRVVYGVNVASKCFTSGNNYALIKSIGTKIPGATVLLFPCNQFDSSEPGAAAQIKDYCVKKGAGFATLFAKGDVNGESRRPVYKFLNEAGLISSVKWNFLGKFVVDRDGCVYVVENDSTLIEDLKELTEAHNAEGI